jgi:hypothetical protein
LLIQFPQRCRILFFGNITEEIETGMYSSLALVANIFVSPDPHGMLLYRLFIFSQHAIFRFFSSCSVLSSHYDVVFSAGSAWIRRGQKRLELSLGLGRRPANLGRASFFDRHARLGLGDLKVVLRGLGPDWRALIGPAKSIRSIVFFGIKYIYIFKK